MMTNDDPLPDDDPLSNDYSLENSVIRFEKLLLVAFILLNLAFSGTISMFIFYFDSKED